MSTRDKIKPKLVKGQGVKPPLKPKAWYAKNANALVTIMHGRVRAYFRKNGQDFTPASMPKLSRLREKFVGIFDEASEPLARGFFNRQIVATKQAFKSAVAPIKKDATIKQLRDAKRKKMSKKERFTVKFDDTDKTSKDLELEQFSDAIDENVELIKSIPTEYFDKIGEAVEARTTGQMTRGALVKRIKELGGITQRRAEMIADDQTAKVTESMTIQRCKNAGIKKVMWVHSGISMTPRNYHKTRWDGRSGIKNGRPNGLNGYVFEINRPPVIDLKTGERGLPASGCNCKCRLVPVIEL